VPSFANYGAFSGRSPDELLAGARVDVAPYKRDAGDFVLWKPSKEGEPGWPSPCGMASLGRPGWHIECSAMSWKHLGEVFDIHGGGIDLVFPHHENEVAQSTCAFGHGAMANVFMHNGFLQVEGKKMSKSEGNFVTINELLATDRFGGRAWSGQVLRLAMLRTHYRQPIDFTVASLQETAATLERLFDKAEGQTGGPVDAEVLAVLCDDLNLPGALARIHHIKDPAILAGTLSLLGFSMNRDDLKSSGPLSCTACRNDLGNSPAIKAVVNFFWVVPPSSTLNIVGYFCRRMMMAWIYMSMF
jgi:cysteinyl-tRNA synthetase